ncbi:hypothetical protein [Tropicimonas sp. IMCC34043]|uniref:hypothetical protein n=1 Tax=Tropicimonas sp. IMCC34043 TaxID=2248760 RepID=UPI000E248C9D|nr:hypothetical protein [Tropicimonas sp. IMCC34043]
MDLADFSIAALNSLSVEGSGLARRAIVPPAAQGEGFDEAYDRTTLWYDALAQDGRVLLICPKLLNLRTLINDGNLKLDGVPSPIRRVRHFRRHDIVELKAAHPPARIETSAGRWTGGSGVSPDQTALFAGLNASLHISRNNRLDWIADWARFHIGEHGLQAMLIMDNGSDAYPPEAILEALIPTGLQRAVVLKVPQSYGPVRTKAGGGGAKFLQPAMLNLARLRFLARARAVLNADLDELVWSAGGSIFDAAVDSPLGLVPFAGEWRQPGPEAEPPWCHAQHDHTRPGARPCPPKYCLRPGGWLGRGGWDVHRPEMPLSALWPRRRDFGYWHCRAITTNWKSYNRLSFRKAGSLDPVTRAKLDARLPCA